MSSVGAICGWVRRWRGILEDSVCPGESGRESSDAERSEGGGNGEGREVEGGEVGRLDEEEGGIVDG